MDLTLTIIVILFFFRLVLISIGLITKWTGGLFFSRTPKRFYEDRYDTRYDSERQVGIQLSNGLLKYVPPISIVFLIVLVLKWFQII